MYPPPDYSVLDGHVYRLYRSLYSLKQAPRAWFERFTSFVIVAGFVASHHDPALFIHISPQGRTLILLYVDDMLITENDSKYIAFVKAHLSEQFHMFHLVLLATFLRLRSPPHLTATTFLKGSAFMILIVWVLLITALWTLLWSFTLVFVPLTVFLLRISLTIIISLVVLFILASLTLTFLMASTF
jgi:hypothetical protein